MVDTASRAGWHAQHLRHGAARAGHPPSASTRGDRSRLLHEAMRSLDDDDVRRQAQRNPSIVPEDTALNTAWVNDGEGGLRRLAKGEGVEPVLEYGDRRIDAVKRKWHEKAFESTTIVSWVPKSLLREVPNYYPVRDPKTGKKIGDRSRWVMPDDEAGKAEVQRWFVETHKHLTEDVLPGGHDSIHGVVWNYDESAVHVHWMADTLAPLHKDLLVEHPNLLLHDLDGEPVIRYGKPQTLDRIIDISDDGTVAHAPEIRADQIAAIDHEGYLVGDDGQRLRRTTGEEVRASDDLRVEAQQAWGQSSEVTETRVVDGVERKVKITGATKLSRYQEGYREHLLAAGFDVEAEVNPRGTSLAKAAYGASEAERLALSHEQAAVAEAERVAGAEAARIDAELTARAAVLDRREVEVQRKQAYVVAGLKRLDQREAEVETLHRDAAADRSAAASARAQTQADREAWEREEPYLRRRVIEDARAEVEPELRRERDQATANTAAAEAVRREAEQLLETAKAKDADAEELYARVTQIEPFDRAAFEAKMLAQVYLSIKGLRTVYDGRAMSVLDVIELDQRRHRLAGVGDRETWAAYKRRVSGRNSGTGKALTTNPDPESHPDGNPYN
ncbi:hypothetical protein [Gordonia sp. 1D]|uniref:hypothetical protein n=1 Tax=Gordonia sp. 1D TaxID=1737359 RepID=UPI000BB7D2C0|nr:hypothetical protein [Gordonia sp. 1D]ATD71720.1 hypothetical protein CNO18_17105 [Gordonia sp. 1D]